MQRTTIASTFVLALAAVGARAEPNGAQWGAEWPYYGGDAGSTKYSPLAQIDASNVESLQVAWTWNSPDDALVANATTRERPGYFKPTPIMIGGMLYVSTSFSQVAAI